MPLASVGSKNTALDAVFGDLHYTGVPDTFWLALLTAMPTPGDGFTTATEVTLGFGDYERIEITNNGTNWPVAAAGIKASGVDFESVEATDDWGSIVGIALMTSDTGVTDDDCYYFEELLEAKAVPTGSSALFETGTITIEFGEAA